MTITIPTAELLGVLTDVVEFADADKESPHYGVLLSWSGDTGRLTAQAYNGLAGAEARWEPDTGRESLGLGEAGKEAFDASEQEWGADDDHEEWSAFLALSDVKDILKVFKVPATFWRLPLQIAAPSGLTASLADGLTISRTGEWGRPAQKMTVSPLEGDHGLFRDFDELLASGRSASDAPLSFPNYLLGLLGSARSHDVMVQVIPEAGRPVTWRMGDRWAAFIWRAQDTARAQAHRAKRLV